MESYSRVRSVKLRRSLEDAPFGFSVRGGHEHGTGIFVSFVDPRSTAFKQGLKVGDQILRVNGFPVSAAVHHECLSLMKVRPSLHLKVRSVGMLPVKEKNGDPLTWKLVEEQPSLDLVDCHNAHNNGVNGVRGHSRLSDTSSQPDSQPTEAKVFIDISGHSGLGCCICKGPPERPGIFVQSTKSSGVAREAGLRPGDQLLSCNGHSFLHIPFAEAVYYLKSSKQLKLRVLKGAATDLFPGESSGYNSSASSLNGDHAPSPNSTDAIVHEVNQGHSSHESAHRRLTSVTEELLSNNSSGDTFTPNKNGSMALDGGMEWDEVEQVWRSAERETIVIEVKGLDPSLRSEEQRLVEERRKLQESQRRLLEEAIKLDEEKRRFEEEKRRTLNHIPDAPDAFVPDTEISISLAGALNQEILKRVERRESSTPGKEDERPKPGTVEQKRSLFNSQIDQEKRQQHEQLIEEFKRAHRKMFAHTLAEEAMEASSGDSMSASAVLRNRKQKELDHERQMVAQRVAGIVRQRQLRIEREHQESEETEREIRSKSPPPPPPMPTGDVTMIKEVPPTPNPKFGKKAPAPLAPAALQMQTKKVIIEEKSTKVCNNSPTKSVKGQAPPPPPPQRAGSELQNKTQTEQTGKKPVRRPESPSPDYSNSPSPIPSPPRIHKPIGVDMQSLESFRLKDPPRSSKKPPPVYFSHNNQGSNQPRLAAYPTSRMNTDFLEGNNTRNDYLIQKELEDALARCNLSTANNKQQIRSNGGILKQGVTPSQAPQNPKTISFVGKY